MANAERLSPISVENYLACEQRAGEQRAREQRAGEQRARVKHEYVAGMVYAMAGGTYAHNLIASNVSDVDALLMILCTNTVGKSK